MVLEEFKGIKGQAKALHEPGSISKHPSAIPTMQPSSPSSVSEDIHPAGRAATSSSHGFKQGRVCVPCLAGSSTPAPACPQQLGWGGSPPAHLCVQLLFEMVDRNTLKSNCFS